MKDKQRLFATLLGLVGLLVVGCTAVEGEPTAVAIAETSPTVLPTETATLELTEPATALPTATETVVPTSTPVPTETPTAVPTPTSTPFAEPVGTILFAGAPCFKEHTTCSDLTLWDRWQWYQIASDGSGLRPIEQLQSDDYVIETIRFSADGSRMAYTAISDRQQIFVADLQNSNPVLITTAPNFRSDLLGGFDFVPNSDCLLVYWHGDIQRDETEKVVIEQSCPAQSETKVIDTIEFLNLRPASTWSQLSPQGDELLIWGIDWEQNHNFYLYELQSGQEPILLLSSPRDDYIFHSQMRWHTDGEHLEYLLYTFSEMYYTNYEESEISITHHVIDRTGKMIDISSGSIFSNGQWGTAWSPNREELLFLRRDLPYEQNGLFIRHLPTGNIRQVLPAFFLNRNPIWSPLFP